MFHKKNKDLTHGSLALGVAALRQIDWLKHAAHRCITDTTTFSAVLLRHQQKSCHRVRFRWRSRCTFFNGWPRPKTSAGWLIIARFNRSFFLSFLYCVDLELILGFEAVTMHLKFGTHFYLFSRMVITFHYLSEVWRSMFVISLHWFIFLLNYPLKLL